TPPAFPAAPRTRASSTARPNACGPSGRGVSSSFMSYVSTPFAAVQLELAEERGGADAQLRGRLGLVVAGGLEHRQDVVALHLLQRADAAGRRGIGQRQRHLLGQIVG